VLVCCLPYIYLASNAQKYWTKVIFHVLPIIISGKNAAQTPGVMWLLEGAKLKHGYSRLRDAAPCSHIKSMKIVHQMRHHPILTQVLLVPIEAGPLSLHWHIIERKKEIVKPGF
jgi:hypothetical protein